jgi:dTDP-4-amino-4,6-dideoxygalactose transaminase
MKFKVELIDLRARYSDERNKIINILDKLLKKGNLILTPEVELLENEIANYTGSKYCLGLNSGTDALMMSLWACGIKKGDEVITSAISFIASAGAIVHLGAIPIFADVNEDLNIDPLNIEKLITRKTKAIMPVHWTGRMCDMDKITKISKKYNLKIIEDAAQGMGSYYKKKHAGRFSKVAAFSAHPLKNLNGIGDSGFITTDDKSIYNKIKLYRNHGLAGRDNVKIFGVNSRMDTINAEIIRFRLKKLKTVITKRKKNIRYYRNFLRTDKVKIIPDKKFETNSYVMFIVLCENRDELKKYLEKHKIQSLIYYGNPLHKHEASKGIKLKSTLQKSEYYASKVLALPHHQNLSKKDIFYVCEVINKFYQNRR